MGVYKIRIEKAFDFDLDLLSKRKANMNKIKGDTTLVYAGNALQTLTV